MVLAIDRAQYSSVQALRHLLVNIDHYKYHIFNQKCRRKTDTLAHYSQPL